VTIRKNNRGTIPAMAEKSSLVNYIDDKHSAGEKRRRIFNAPILAARTDFTTEVVKRINRYSSLACLTWANLLSLLDQQSRKVRKARGWTL
jgi:hypothetical protein